MKSITIHGLDDTLERYIKKKAEKDGLSLNKTIKKLLVEALGIKKKRKDAYRKEFMDCFGVWTAAEEKQFSFNIADFEKIVPGDWN